MTNRNEGGTMPTTKAELEHALSLGRIVERAKRKPVPSRGVSPALHKATMRAAASPPYTPPTPIEWMPGAKLTGRHFKAMHETEGDADHDTAEIVARVLPILSKKERAFFNAYREFREALQRPLEVPDALLEHGRMPLRVAARLVGKSIDELTGSGKYAQRYRSEFSLLPVFKRGETITSEALRAFKVAARERLDKLGRAAAVHLNDYKPGTSRGDWPGVPTGPYWSVSMNGASAFVSPLYPGFLVAAEIAPRLRVSLAEARRLISSGTLFGRCGAHGRTYVSVEEVQAYERKLAAKAQDGWTTPQLAEKEVA